MICVAAATLLLVGACSGIEKPPHRSGPNSYALENPEGTTLARIYKERAVSHEARSGFALMKTGRDAFLTLVALTQLAEKTLDLQYYIWRTNRTGRLLINAIAAAAERGVRVRLLLDDVDLDWKDRDLERLSLHPNISIRVFNPFATRDAGIVDLIFDFDRVNHRMHNKAFVADNSAAVVGGRNVGDRFYSVDDIANFRDLDLFAVGPIVRDVSRTFDEFWNSDWSIPIAELSDAELPPLRSPHIPKDLGETVRKAAELVFDKQPKNRNPMERYRAVFDRLIWTDQAAVLADRANKPESEQAKLLKELRSVLAGRLDNELLLEIAYLIPDDSGVAFLCGIVKRGIKVRILTNSFKSNDLVVAYAGYRKFRKDLLACGIDIAELRPDPAFVKKDWSWVKPSSNANLHTKAMVLDRQDIVIGSFNMDPRSIKINTEIALVVRSRPLAKEVAAFIESGMAGPNAYHLDLEDGEIVWIEEQNGETRRLHDEPGDSFRRILVSRIVTLLPIEGQL